MLVSHKVIAEPSQSQRVSEKLKPRFYGPYKIVDKIGPVTYRVDLPTGHKVHNVFHVSRSKRFVRSDHGVLPGRSDLPAGPDEPRIPGIALMRRFTLGCCETEICQYVSTGHQDSTAPASRKHYFALNRIETMSSQTAWIHGLEGFSLGLPLLAIWQVYTGPSRNAGPTMLKLACVLWMISSAISLSVTAWQLSVAWHVQKRYLIHYTAVRILNDILVFIFRYLNISMLIRRVSMVLTMPSRTIKICVVVNLALFSCVVNGERKHTFNKVSTIVQCCNYNKKRAKYESKSTMECV